MCFWRHKDSPIETLTKLITHNQEVLMSAIDDLNVAITALQAEDALVEAAVASLNTQVATLTAAVAAATQVDPAIEAAAQAVQAEVANLTAAITPPVPPAPAA